jgi:tetratricopeptide (TPR) repeat protein
MSRFVNLELGGHEEESSRRERVVKDAVYYFAEASRAFESMEFEESLRLHGRAIEDDPGFAAAWTGQVRALIELGEYREASVWADKALEHFPREAELLAAKAVALGRIGEIGPALAFSDAAVEQPGESPYVWLARGDVLLAAKEQRAEYCLEKALALAAGNWFVAWLAGRIRFYYRQFMLALKLAQRAVEWHPHHAPCWLLLGLCQQEIGMVGPARQSLEHASQLRPRWTEVHKASRAVDDTGFFRRVAGGVRGLFH